MAKSYEGLKTPICYDGRNLANHCHYPPTALNLQETGGAVTHALQVLHTLQWHHPGGRALLQLAQAPTQDYHSYTNTLYWVALKEKSRALAAHL